MPTTLPSQRHLFDIPDDIVYMNTSFVSPLLKEVRQVGEEAVSRKSAPWLLRAEDFFDETETARDLFARIVGASAEDIALIPSATYGISTAARNIDLAPGDEILIQGEEFPSVYYPLKRLCDDRGAKLVTVAKLASGGWTEALLTAMSSRTKAVAVTPSHWTDGSVVDCKAVGERAREIEAVYIIDGCQSVGAVAFDVSLVKPDFLVVPTYKWMMGPYGYGFLYVSPRFQSGRPLEENWFSRRGAEDFSNLVNYQDEYQPGARRFDMGERSNFILLPMAIAAMRQILDWQPAMIAATLEQVTDEIAEAALANGFAVYEKAFRSPHMIGIRKREGFSKELRDRLAAQNIFVSFRGDSMRVAPHVHLSRRDLEKFLSELQRIARGR